MKRRHPMPGVAPLMTGESAGVALSPAVDGHLSRADLDEGVKSDTDEELLLLAARGDREAFVALHDRLAPLVSINAYRILLDEARSHAVTEETFAELFGHPIDFDPHRDRAREWVLTRAHQRATDRLRSPVGVTAAPEGHEDVPLDQRTGGSSPPLRSHPGSRPGSSRR